MMFTRQPHLSHRCKCCACSGPGAWPQDLLAGQRYGLALQGSRSSHSRAPWGGAVGEGEVTENEFAFQVTLVFKSTQSVGDGRTPPAL